MGELERHRSDWDALAERVGAPPFLRPEWIAAWWQVFGKGRLEVLTAHRGGSLRAALPIAFQRGAAVSPSNTHTPAFGLLHEDAGAAAAIAAALFARRPRRVSLGFLELPATVLNELTRAAEAARYRVLVRVMHRSPRVLIEGEWDAYERALGGNLRRDLGRCLRRLRELGRVTLDVGESTVDLDHRLAEAFALERSGWKGERGTAIASRPQTAAFYTQIAHWAAARGWLRLIFLRVEERPIAVHLAIEQGGAYFPLKGGFDPAFSAYSPGKLIIRATLERAFSIGLQRYEFLGGDDHYKRRWSTDQRERILFQAFASRPSGLIEHAAFAYGRPLALRARETVRRLPQLR